jgi:FkbM family methyltransferase
MLIKINNDSKTVKIKIDPSDWVGNRIRSTKNFYEIQLLNFIKERFSNKSATNVIDIGANIGNHTIFFATYVFNTVYSFEPNTKNYSLLCENCKLNGLEKKIKPYNIAISDKNENYKTFDFIGNMGRSYIEENPIHGDGITKKIDDFIFNNIGLIKIDVEGYEPKVLIGAKNTIELHSPEIVLECNYEYELEAVTPIISSYNYKMIKKIDNMYYYVKNI